MAYREKTFRLALQGREGFFRAAYGGCMDYFLRKARKMPNAEELRKANVPFPLTDSLLSLLQLPYGSKAPLFFVLRLGLTEEEAGKLLDRSPAAVRHGLDKALKRAGPVSYTHLSLPCIWFWWSHKCCAPCFLPGRR